MQSLRTIANSWPQKPPNDVYFNLIRSLCKAENETGIFTRSTVDVGAEVPEVLADLLMSIETNIRLSSTTVDRSKERRLRQDVLLFLGTGLDQPWPRLVRVLVWFQDHPAKRLSPGSIVWTAKSVPQYLKQVMGMGQSTENNMILESMRNLVDSIKPLNSESDNEVEYESPIWKVPEGDDLRREFLNIYKRFEAFVARRDVTEVGEAK